MSTRVRRCIRLALACVFALALSSCGFHLKGALAMPSGIQNVYVQATDPLSPLKQDIEQNLRANDIEVADEPGASSATIVIVSDSLQREILSVNERARVSEYLLRYQATVQINAGSADSERALLTQSQFELSREYSFDERQALGAAQEEEIITGELRVDMAQLILRKLAVTRMPKK